MDKEKLRHLHYLLAGWITKLGEKSWKKHGEYRDFTLGTVHYHVDTYSKAIKINDFYLGCDFGGFEPTVDFLTYRQHIGKLYQYWLKNCWLK